MFRVAVVEEAGLIKDFRCYNLQSAYYILTAPV